MKKQIVKKAPAEQLYFVGILPPDDIQQEVTVFKQQALDQFKAGNALASPPHITLLPPFKSSRTDFSVLSEFAAQKQPMEVALNGFDKFDQRVIFVAVQPNETLVALQKDLELYAHYHLGIEPEYRPYIPHMTVALKDLKRPNFPAAFAHFSAQSYERTFTGTALSLFRSEARQWVKVDEWTLGGL
ncbi:MAG: 2'-5' RNA ligase family protein [Cytophagales bacterium]|nr:MAG: 2'-5' RNA ligase family protein [Cytophagales bacterium]